MSAFHEGQKVVYRAPHVRADEPGEEGVVVRDGGGDLVHVRYGTSVTVAATPRDRLTPITPTRTETDR